MISGLAARISQRRRDPVAVQALRSTAAAVISYVVALRLSSEPNPLTAPLTALLVVQVTLYSTLTTGIRRVNSVVVGVLIAIAFSVLVGLTWWSLGLLILASLVVGHLVRVDEFVPEVAISAMLVLGVTQVADTAWDRVLETLIGAAVGLLVNLLVAPPVWVGPAGAAITDLAMRMSGLLNHIGDESLGAVKVEQAAARLHEARRLANDIAQVDASLRQAEDSLRLNPRVKEGLLFRLVLRTGLDTLEICAVVLRVACRTLTDLAKARPDGPLFATETTIALGQVLRHTALAVESFAQLITAQVSANAEEAEARLTGSWPWPGRTATASRTCCSPTSARTRPSGSCRAHCSRRSTGSSTNWEWTTVPSACWRNWTTTPAAGATAGSASVCDAAAPTVVCRRSETAGTSAPPATW